MNFKESKPIYLQIADRICDELLQGRYAETDRIPSVRDYAATVEVNANTAMRSYDFLQSRSVIRMQRGIGYFVEPSASERIRSFRRESFMNEELRFLPASPFHRHHGRRTRNPLPAIFIRHLRSYVQPLKHSS